MWPSSEPAAGARHGFTLIELLLVLVVIALATSLTTPLLVRAYTAFQADFEYRRVQLLVERAADEAYAKAAPFRIQSIQQRIELRRGDDIVREIQLEHLACPEGRIAFNERGYASRTRLECARGEQIYVVQVPAPRRLPE